MNATTTNILRIIETREPAVKKAYIHDTKCRHAPPINIEFNFLVFYVFNFQQ